MDEWMIRWAFMAPFVTVGTQLCGFILMGALISYNLAFFTIQARSPWGAGVAICLSMLIVWARTSLAVLAAEPPTPDKVLIAREFSSAGLLITALVPLWGLVTGKNILPLRRVPVLAWDSLFGISYTLGFLSCGAYFVTLTVSASVAGASGIAQLSAYALGLLVLTITLLLILALLRRFILQLVSEGNVRHIRAFALAALATAGLLTLWT
jgi:hypothetical protein